MSKKFIIERFFPSIYGTVKTIIPRTYSAILPDDIAVLCPEPTIAFSYPTVISNDKAPSILIIRNPLLFANAILGFVIGMFGGIRFAKNKEQLCWSHSFFNFAMMNVTAMLLHCLLPPPESIYADQHPVLWFLDCYFTGVSSTLIVGGTLGCLHTTPKWTPRTWICLANGLGLIAAGFFLQLTRINSSIRTLSLELWYLIPTVFAGCLLLPSLYFGKRTKRGLTIALYVGCSLCLIGALFDAKRCRLAHGMLLMASSLVFTGCNVVFVLLGLSLDAQGDGKKKMW
jgi:hypothetical protein